jgi:hypothetical protein
MPANSVGNEGLILNSEKENQGMKVSNLRRKAEQMAKPAFNYEQQKLPFEERKHQSTSQLIMLRNQSQCEADEFSFVNEHVLDEPSIHVRTIAHLPNRM